MKHLCMLPGVSVLQCGYKEIRGIDRVEKIYMAPSNWSDIKSANDSSNSDTREQAKVFQI